MNFIETAFQQGVIEPLLYLFNPHRRIAWIYLFSAGIIAILVYHFRMRLSVKDSIKEVFNKKYWWSTSAKTDYILFFICGITKALLVIPYLSVGSLLAYSISLGLTDLMGPSRLTISQTTLFMTYPLALFLVKDLFVYIAHYYLHKSKILWEFHKVHHSAETMNPFTLYRMHPVEMLIQNLQGMLAFALVTGIFYYMNCTLLARATILGINAFSFCFFIFGANLRHSHVPFSYPRWLEHILISPYQHQIHHDANPKFCHSNFGSRLALWDLLFGTLHTSRDLSLKERRFGLPPNSLRSRNTWKGNLISPFIGISRLLTPRRSNVTEAVKM